MAKTDQYMAEAFSELEKLSADERKRLEYEAREKAVRDYNSLMGGELRRGLERGIEEGKKQGIEQGRRALVIHMLENGMSPEDIMRVAGVSEEEINAAKKESKENL